MMLKAKMFSIDFVSWDWKVEKKLFFSKEKIFFFRDANSTRRIACSNRSKRRSKRDVLSDRISRCQDNRSIMSR